MNPIAVRRQAKPGMLLCCPQCGDRGFTEPAGGLKRTGDGWTCKEIFERGIACSCAAGSEFAQQQMEWHQPIRPMSRDQIARFFRKHSAEHASIKKRPGDAPWTVPADLAQKLKAKIRPASPASATPTRVPAVQQKPITQADINREVERRRENK